MALESSDPEQARVRGEIDSVREPLINGVSVNEEYSVRAAILPFLFPAFGGLLFGYDIGATSGATISLQSPTLSGTTWYDLSSVEIGLVVSGSLYGALIGSALAYIIADFLGRRRELILSSLVYFVGALFTALAPNFPVMVVGRFLFGIGIGLVNHLGLKLFSMSFVLGDVISNNYFSSIKFVICGLGFFFSWLCISTDNYFDSISLCLWLLLHMIDAHELAMHAAPMYIAETAPSEIRGTLISMKEFFIVFGMLLGYISGAVYVVLVSGWRYMFASSAPICIIMAIGMWWLPPSPRWLLLCSVQGKRSLSEAKEAAINCLCRLRGQAIDSSASVQVEIILAELSYSDQEKEAKFSEIFQGKSLKALTIGAGLVFFQQVTGQPSVLYYAATILQSAGFPAATDATRVSVLLGLLKLIMTGVAVLVVDRIGRRPLLIGGVSGIAISLFLLSSYYTFLEGLPAIAVIALLLYVGCYQLSFGPIGWLMISEVFPLRSRGKGLSIAVLVNFATNALVTFAFSPLEVLVGTSVLFAGFGVIAIASLLFIFFVVPETKGLTLEEIEAKIL